MEKTLKYLLIVVMLIGITGTVRAQHKVIKYEGGRKSTRVEAQLDSLLKVDTIYRTNDLGKADTLIVRKTLSKKDSVIHRELTPKTDSLYKESATQIKDSTVQVDIIKIDTIFLRPTSTLPLLKEAEVEKKEEKEHRKFFLFRDELPAGRVTLISLVPGMGQVYNRQYWKIPAIYGAMGGFVAGGVVSSNRYKEYRTEWQRTVDMKLPQSQQDFARGKMDSEGMIRTLFYGAAAATYFYQIADATFNYRGKVDHIRKATTLAAVFPGAGFIYTRTYWRLPIYYGGFATLATVVDYNNRYYHKYATAYNAATDNDPTTTVESSLKNIDANRLLNARNGYRRNRDLGIISLVGVYILSIVDTHVIATLKNWDISPDLSMTIEPTIINNSIHRASMVPSGAGMSLKIKF